MRKKKKKNLQNINEIVFILILLGFELKSIDHFVTLSTVASIIIII